MELTKPHKQTVNMSRAERIASAVGGGLLAVAALRRRSPSGLLLGLIGGDLLRRSMTGHCWLYQAIGVSNVSKGQGAETTSVPYRRGIRVDQAVTINRPRSEVYQFWRNLGNLPRFMKNVTSVTLADGNRSHWVVAGPAGCSVEWDAIVINQLEDEMLAWRSLPGADVDHAGSVWFSDAPGARGTEVKVELQYNPPAGALGAAVAMLWGKEPTRQIHDDLHRLKQILEAGEIPTTEGQPSGRGIREAAKSKSARDREVHDASAESFPASDSPVYR